jgi:hypothetical protein
VTHRRRRTTRIARALLAAVPRPALVTVATLATLGTSGLLAPRSAAAQSGGGLGGSIGANVPVADYGDAAKLGLVLNGFAELRPTQALGLRAELFWSRSDIENPLVRDAGSVTLGPEFRNATGDVDLVGASADLLIALRGGAVQPYLIGGAGVFRRRVSQDVLGAVDEFRDLRESDTDVGFNGGVGLRFWLAGVAAFAEARYYSVATPGTRTNFVPVTVGFTF